jgi:hypothetical protein
MIGTIHKKQTPISNYQPNNAVRDLIVDVQKDYHEGVRILEQAWLELNDRTVIEDQNIGQMMFNAYVDTSVDDPHEAWKWRGTRSKARNKAIAMHAQLTANYLLPTFIAQNENDEVDKDYSEVMRDIIEWLAQPTNSNYQQAFMQAAFGMMYNPVTYLSADFCQIYQTIKEKTNKGVSKKEVLDDVLSGFKVGIWSANQILITNAYERNIQRQKCIIKRRYIDYDEAEAKYGDHENFAYVQTGVKSVYNDDDELFYDVKDDDHPNTVVEEIYLNRREDLEIPFVGGVYMGDSNPDDNPIKHRDHKDRPKYNVVPFGYMRIGEHFFYYKSMMNALRWDNLAYDAMSEIVFNRAILEVEMPIAISGTDKVDSQIVFPNSVASFEDKDTKVSPLLPPTNLAAGFNTLTETGQSMEEGSVNETLAGQLPDASQKAFNVAQAQANAKKLIGAVGKSLAESVIQFGGLMKDIAINHITIPQLEELTGGRQKMKYKTFLLENKKDGKKIGDRVIKFDEALIGQELTDDEIMEKNLELLESTDYPKEQKTIRLVNPVLFRKHDYLTKVDLEMMFNKSDEYMQPLLMSLRQQLINDPFIDMEALDRKLLYSFFQSEGEEFIKEQEQQVPGVPQMPPAVPTNQLTNQPANTAVNKNIV